LKFVEAEIVMDDQENDQCTADADGKSQYIDQREYFVPDEIPIGDGEISL
jgi:hypothetical protein